jgi:osmotically inducible protein OsmC
MAIRTASAVWNGGLKDGKGALKLGSGAWEGKYSFATRFEEEPGSNPEELIGAAHAGCFSMALSGALGKAGFAARRIATEARVHLSLGEGGFSITRIELHCQAEVPGIEPGKFAEIAQAAKQGCPVSRALAAVPIELEARLV